MVTTTAVCLVVVGATGWAMNDFLWFLSGARWVLGEYGHGNGYGGFGSGYGGGYDTKGDGFGNTAGQCWGDGVEYV